jgi:hypothetical protein
MVDRKTMQSRLENMERAAEEILQQDSAFYEVLLALKSEIDDDPEVQAKVGELKAAGRSVFNSFVPHVKIRVRTEEGIFALPKPAPVASAATSDEARLIQQLKDAASAVIRNSKCYRELDVLVNEVIGASSRFEGIASQIEREGHDVLICLDLSTYAQVQATALLPKETRQMNLLTSRQEPAVKFSHSDRAFLAGLKIRIDAEPLGI